MPKAKDILARKSSEVATVDHEATVRDAALLMNTHRIGSVVVTHGERVVGIFTERDILQRVVAKDRDPASTKVHEVMSTPMAVCHRETPLVDCRALMTNKRIRHLPVVEDGRLMGIISSGDLLAFEVADQQTTIEYLHDYLYGRT